jgi:hypothetical protein
MCVAFLAVPGVVFSQNASDLGEVQGNSVINIYGSKSGITNNVSNPLTSSNTPMTTTDGSTSFSGQLQCPNSQKFMEVLIQPGTTGDITTFMVSQDTNFDGNLDYAYQVPFPVSGICANGVIACDPGTWTNCRTYQWTSDTSGRIGLQVVPLTTLGGCFCVNNSCGTNLIFANTPTIMNAVGGAVTGAIQKNDSRYAISNVVIDGMDATYYGQNSGGCVAASSGYTNAEQYYYNPGALASDATSQAAAQAAVSGSMYSTLKTSDAAGNYQTATCTIARGDSIVWDTNYQCFMEYGISNGCSVLENNPNCTLRTETIDGVTTVENYLVTGLEPLSSCENLSSTVSASCDYSCPLGVSYPCTGTGPTCTNGSITVSCSIINPIVGYGGSWTGCPYLTGSGSTLYFLQKSTTPVYTCPLGSFACSYNWGTYMCSGYFDGQWRSAVCTQTYPTTTVGSIQFMSGVSVWGTIDTNADFNCWRYNWVGVTGAGTDPSGNPYDGAVSVTTQYGGYTGWIYFKGINVSGGGSMAGQWGTVTVTAGSSWDLYTTYLYYHGSGTGSGSVNFSPNICPIAGGSACVGVPSFCSKSCSGTDCEQWWKKTRTYTCTTDGYDFSGIKKRVSTVKQSARDDTSSMSYNDYYLSGTTWTTGSSSYATGNVYRGNIGSCQQACKTMVNADNTSTNIAYKKSDVSLDTTTPQYFYHACTSGVCPAGTGETIITDCQCIDDFAEAAVIMQILRKGAQDIICSDGTEIGLQ